MNANRSSAPPSSAVHLGRSATIVGLLSLLSVVAAGASGLRLFDKPQLTTQRTVVLGLVGAFVVTLAILSWAAALVYERRKATTIAAAAAASFAVISWIVTLLLMLLLRYPPIVPVR